MTNGLKINVEFEKLTNTDFWEQYMTNAFQFSAAKCEVERRIIQQSIYDENGQKRSFSQFRNNIDQQLSTMQDSWWRTEYDLAVNGSIQAEKWRNDIWKNRDLNPYATFRASMQTFGSKTCPECESLNGLTFEIDSSEANRMMVPVHFNCGCSWETSNSVDKLSSDDELNEKIDKNIAPMFQHNVGTDGIMPSAKHSYFDVLPNANKLTGENFSSKIQSRFKLNLVNYSEHAIKLTIHDWSQKAPKADNLIFQNKEWKLNYRLTYEAMKKIHKNSRGFENLKPTIERPDEIWARWENPEKQKKVLINFLKFYDKYCYCVETKSGYIVDAYLLYHKDAINERRKGVKFIK
jgi:SPP1 gp7 family putative phage head morphogenesis protein